MLYVSQSALPKADEIRLSLVYNHSIEEEHYVDFEIDPSFEAFRSYNGKCSMQMNDRMFIMGDGGNDAYSRYLYEG